MPGQQAMDVALPVAAHLVEEPTLVLVKEGEVVVARSSIDVLRQCRDKSAYDSGVEGYCLLVTTHGVAVNLQRPDVLHQGLQREDCSVGAPAAHALVSAVDPMLAAHASDDPGVVVGAAVRMKYIRAGLQDVLHGCADAVSMDERQLVLHGRHKDGPVRVERRVATQDARPLAIQRRRVHEQRPGAVVARSVECADDRHCAPRGSAALTLAASTAQRSPAMYPVRRGHLSGGVTRVVTSGARTKSAEAPRFFSKLMHAARGVGWFELRWFELKGCRWGHPGRDTQFVASRPTSK